MIVPLGDGKSKINETKNSAVKSRQHVFGVGRRGGEVRQAFESDFSISSVGDIHGEVINLDNEEYTSFGPFEFECMKIYIYFF